MSQDSFDEHIRQTLADHQSEVDAQAIWEAVKPQRKRRGLWLWLLAPALLVGAGLGAWRLFYPSGATLAEREPAAISAPRPHAAENTACEPLENTTTAKAADMRTARIQPTSATQPLAGRSVDPARRETSAVQPWAISRADAPAYMPPTPSAALAIAATPGAPSSAAQGSDTTTANAAPQPPATPMEEAQPADDATEHQWLWAAERLPSLLTAVDQSVPVAPKASPAPPKTPPTRWYAGLQAAAYLPFRSLEEGAQDSSGSYSALRRGTETPLEVLGLEFTLGRKLRPNLRLQTGLAINRLTERFEWRADQLLRDSVTGIQAIFIDAAGDSILVEGPVLRTQYISRYKRAYNTYTFVDLPLIAAFDLGKGRLQLSLEAGLWLNLSLRAQGSRLLTNGTDVERLEDSSDYRSRAGLSFHGGLGARYRLGRRWALNGSVAMRYFPGAITTEAVAATQQYQWLGARLGLLYCW